MLVSLAPMEGLTGHTFRQVHAAIFGPLDRYYTPFVTPPHPGANFGKKAAAELDPANNGGLCVVPQLLTNNAEDFIWAATLLAKLGYAQVNLNVGCPSGTVVPKGRGAGFLAHLAELDAFLGKVCEDSPIPVSVKTRLGMESDAEFEQVLAVYARHPLKELIVHPRVRKDFYKGTPRTQAYGQALEMLPFPVAYNGDIFAPSDLAALTAAYPFTQHVMLGRGILANPALARELIGGSACSREELELLHNRLLEAYQAAMGPNALYRMKEWWHYAKCMFAHPLEVHRAVRKTKTLDAYRTAAAEVLKHQPLAAQPRFVASLRAATSRAARSVYCRRAHRRPSVGTQHLRAATLAPKSV